MVTYKTITNKNTTQKDIKDILKLEGSFFGGKISEAPAETKEGLEFFLNIGGEVIIQYNNKKTTGCIELIPFKNIRELDIDSSILNHSPLKGILTYKSHFGFNERDILIHCWVGLNGTSKWLFRKLLKQYGNNLVGFILREDKRALRFYSPIMRIIGEVPKLYLENDPHYIVRYKKDSSN